MTMLTCCALTGSTASLAVTSRHLTRVQPNSVADVRALAFGTTATTPSRLNVACALVDATLVAHVTCTVVVILAPATRRRWRSALIDAHLRRAPQRHNGIEAGTSLSISRTSRTNSKEEAQQVRRRAPHVIADVTDTRVGRVVPTALTR